MRIQGSSDIESAKEQVSTSQQCSSTSRLYKILLSQKALLNNSIDGDQATVMPTQCFMVPFY